MLGCLSHVQSNVHAQSRLSSTLQDYGGRILDLIPDDFLLATFIAFFNLLMLLNLHSLVTLQSFHMSLYLKHLAKRLCKVI